MPQESIDGFRRLFEEKGRNMNIAHLTSAHPRFDTRIFHKQCRSLAKHGYTISLVVADDKGDENENKVSIYDVGASKNRLNRIFKTTTRVFKKAIELDADVYHLHDPELIPIGLKLRRLGKIVIFDSHEDVPLQMRAKPYLNAPLRYLIGQAFGYYESYACKKMNAVITATPFIRDKFLKINANTVDINNFPILDELMPTTSWGNKESYICYIGGIEKVRGIHEIIQALEYRKTNLRLRLAGSFRSKETEKIVKSYHGWNAVDELGYLDRKGVNNVLQQSIAGLVTLHPIINYVDALPVKMFEYMSAGIPVIASDFPLWREIIEKNNCGICVDPLNPVAIADAMGLFLTNPEKAKKMGENGRKAVLKKYNWGAEEKKLLILYSSIITDHLSKS